MGRGRVAVIGVVVDGGTDGVAPGVCAEGVDVFVLGQMDGLEHGLGEVRKSGGGSRF